MTFERAQVDLDAVTDGERAFQEVSTAGVTAGEIHEQSNPSPSERDAMPTVEQKYFTASELAGVPGMPTTTRGVFKRAKNEGWPARARAGRGGGSEYPISCLPVVTQAALAEAIVSAAPAATSSLFDAAGAHFSSEARAEQLAALFDTKPDSVKVEARKRLEIVREYSALVGEHGVKREAAIDVVTKKHSISVATLGRYLSLVKGKPEHTWLVELCPAYAGRTAQAELVAEAWETLKADYLRAERPSARACITRLERIAQAKGWTLPSPRTLLRRLNALPRSIRVMKREGMKAAKALFPPQLRDKAALHALQIVNGDGYKHNLWAKDAAGRVFRPKTWFWQDVHSSKILCFRTGETESTAEIQLSFGDLCERYGIPYAVTIDNTLAAANKTMSGGLKHRFRFKVRDDEPDGVFKLLGVDVHWTTPGHGQAKPIERAFGVGGIGEYIDKAPEFAGAWSGSSTKDKPEYDGRSKPVDLAVLERVITREIQHWNAMQGRRSPLHQGRSFDEVFSESYARVQIRKATDAQRRLWLLATEPVRANARDGSITLDAGRVQGERAAGANRYWDDVLIDHAGRQLVAKFDPQHLHEGVHVYTLDGKWICFAACDRPAGFNDQAAARQRNRARNDFTKGVKLQVAAEVRMRALDVAKSQTLASAGGAIDGTIPAPKVVRPVFGESLERPRSAEERAELARIEAEIAAPAPVNVLELRSDADKHAHWKTLNERRGAGEQLADADEAFWQHWQTQDYYRIAVDAEGEFDQEHDARRIA